MQTTFSRKNRSSRKCPLATATSRSRLVAATMRTSTCTSSRPPSRAKSAVLQHLQQLRLQRLMHLADLVEKHRPFVRELELARLLLHRAGEGAALEAEELRFEELRRQRRAVDLHEGAMTARRGRVDRARDQLLARAALTTDQHRDVGIGDTRDQIVHFLHLLAGVARPEQLAGDARRTGAGPGGSRRRTTVGHDTVEGKTIRAGRGCAAPGWP